MTTPDNQNQKQQVLSLARFSHECQVLIHEAQDLADSLSHDEATSFHLLARYEELPLFRELVKLSEFNYPLFKSELARQFAQLPKTTEASSLAAECIQVLVRAEKAAARNTTNPIVSLELLFNSLIQDPISPELDQLLKKCHFTYDKVKPYVNEVFGPKTTFCLQNLSKQAQAGKSEPVIGRDTELRRVIQILGRHFKHNPLLIGEAGVGKKTIVSALTQKIVNGTVPAYLKGVSVYQLNTGTFFSGLKSRGEAEEKLRKILGSFQKARTIIFIHSLETFLTQPGMSGTNGELLSILLSTTNVRLVASITPENLKKLLEKDTQLLSKFSSITVTPPSQQQSIEILRSLSKKYEEHHQLIIGEPAIVSAVKLSSRYIQNRVLPESAIDLLDEAAARKKMELDVFPLEIDVNISRAQSVQSQLLGLHENQDTLSLKVKNQLQQELSELEIKINKQRLAWAEKKKSSSSSGSTTHDANAKFLSEQDIATVLGDWTGIPVAKMLETESDKYTKMEMYLEEKVVGQSAALKALAKSVRRSRAGLRDINKPIGSFLFLGPSGCGKTQAAKALAEFMFDDEQAMVRFDMSEFMEKHMAQRLVGSPNGYADSDQGGQLTEAVRLRPYSVLLFDEVEKAHPDVFNLLLQVLDDGRLTDGRGRTVDFSNTLIIMTSNIGSRQILEIGDSNPEMFESDQGKVEIRRVVDGELKNSLRVEFLNRIDDIVIFQPLTRANLRGIVDIQIRLLEKMMLDKEISLKLSEAAKLKLVEVGYDPKYGARPLKRAILKNLQDPLAENIISGKFGTGANIFVSFESGQFNFSLNS